MPDIRHKRGLMSAFVALAAANGLKPGQIYVITDTKQLALAVTSSTYDLYIRGGEQGVTVSDTAPSTPYEGQLWFDTSA